MNKSMETTIDIASTLMAGAALGQLDAPWWAYVLILLFGWCQQAVGRSRGKQSMMNQLGIGMSRIMGRGR